MTKARDLANIISGGFTADDIPSLDTAKITTGTFADARIPSLDASKIATGTITPSDGTVTTDKIVDANVTLAKLSATGTKDATTFLRGDNTFQTISSDYVLLETTTVSSPVSSVTVGNGLLTSSYKFYVIYGHNVIPSNNGDHGFIRIRTSGGQQTSSYQRTRMWMYAGAATVNPDASLSATSIEFGFGQSVNGTHGADFISYIANPSSTSIYKTIKTLTQTFDSSPHLAQHHTTGAWTGGTNAITGIDYFWQSGNTNSGIFKLYGVK